MSDLRPHSNGAGVLVPDSPAVKRQRTTDGWTSSRSGSGYNSHDDDGDALFEGIHATPGKLFSQPTQPQYDDRSTSVPFETQPTQLIDRAQHANGYHNNGGYHGAPLGPSSQSRLQVPASSPLREARGPSLPPSSIQYSQFSGPQPNGLSQFSQPVRQPPRNPALMQPRQQSNGPARQPIRRFPANNVATSMAPRGTVYHTPNGIIHSIPRKVVQPIVIPDDDEGPQYLGGSSDDEGNVGARIKPTSFTSTTKSTLDESRAPMPVSGARYISLTNDSPGPAPRTNFSNIVQSARYEPQRPSNTHMTNVASRHPYPAALPGYQSGPSRALPVGTSSYDHVGLDDEAKLRKVNRITSILGSSCSAAQARHALALKKWVIEDAMAYIVEREPIPEPEPQNNMARGLARPIASIRDRYNQPRPQTQSRPAVVQIPSSSQEIPHVAPEPEKKKKRGLVQGRKNVSPPALPTSNPVPIPITLSDDDDRDSDREEENEPVYDAKFDDRVLKFLNTAEVSELADLVILKVDVIQGFVNARPFSSLDAAEDFSDAKPTKTGKRSARAPVGARIVELARQVMEGYEAVDFIVKQCENYAQPLTSEMTKWGFDVNGAGKEGEIAITSLDAEDDADIAANNDAPLKVSGRGVTFLKQPEMMSKDIVLKDYQLVGLNWLNMIYKNNLSCILADDMGLGKTCQVISFLTHLVETGDVGPHLVIVPSSVVENWLREFMHFSPDLVVKAYAGTQGERAELAEEFLEGRGEINVVVASYDNSKRPDDLKFLRKLKPEICIFDEGHALKNPDSQRYKALMRITARMRILLTGTPLQNNLLELAAVLAFILPDVFLERKDDLAFIFKHRAKTSDSDHAQLLSTQRTQRARSMLTPFVLRRKKEQVMKHMPAKVCRIQYCKMEPAQAKIYKELASRTAELKAMREDGVKASAKGENNPIMQLRKAAIHHMLFRRHFTDAKLRQMLPLLKKNEPVEFKGRDDQVMGEMWMMSDYILHNWCRLYPCIRKFDTPDLEWMNSGKVKALVKLLHTYKQNGDRALVFSQFTMVLDVLQEVLQTSQIQYSRIDGATRVDERQTLIDQFRDDEAITVFLLSTGAGGQGINLMYANKVIIFDQSFNPQDDIQAENRAHRVGQTRDVEVVRLISRGTIEEAMYTLGQSKLALDDKVAGIERDEASMKSLMEKKVLEMLVDGKMEVDGEEVKMGEVEVAEDVEKETDIKTDDDSTMDTKAQIAAKAKSDFPAQKTKLVILKMPERRSGIDTGNAIESAPPKSAANNGTSNGRKTGRIALRMNGKAATGSAAKTQAVKEETSDDSELSELTDPDSDASEVISE